MISKISSDILYGGPSNPAETSCTLGGVGHNIAGTIADGLNHPDVEQCCLPTERKMPNVVYARVSLVSASKVD